MKSFLKGILERDIFYSLEKVPNGGDGNVELRYVKFLQKIIFKHDFMVEFEELLKSACSSEPFTVKNDMIKKLIFALNSVLLSDVDSRNKINVFRCIFETFILSCKEYRRLPALQFFMILVHILGMDTFANEDIVDTDCIVNADNFKHAFGVKISTPSRVSYAILKELLVCFSKQSLIMHLSEKSMYHKWLQKLIRKIASTRPFQSSFIEIFSICTDIDLELVEENLEHIIRGVLSQRPPVDEDFSKLYESFLENGLKMSAAFQRTGKFIRYFLTGIKNTPTILAKDIIFPLNFVMQYSKTVALASTQQSLLLMDQLMLNLTECCTAVSENTSGSLSLPIVSDLLVAFLKEVKIFTPNISATTVQILIGKLTSLTKVLQKFGNYVLCNKEFVLKSENIIRSYLQLCLYCGEVQALIDCYKDSVLGPTEIENSRTQKDWLCCLTLKQWNNVVKLVLESNLEMCYPICFQLALHKLRTLKLHKMNLVDESTLKMILFQFKLDPDKFNIFQQVTPEDFTIIKSFLAPDQAKTLSDKTLDHIVYSEGKEWKSWLCDSNVQENFTFIVNLFSELLKKAGSVLGSNKPCSKFSWLLEDYLDGNDINKESLKGLPEKINSLLKSWKKMKKTLEHQEEMIRIFEVFKLLPINYLKEGYRELGLSFAVAVAIIFSHDESAVCLPLESVYCFLVSDADASTCFDVGLCLKWLCELAFERKDASDLKMKVIEGFVRSCPNMKFGLRQVGGMIEVAETLRHESPLKMLESRVVLYQELGKCWQRAKKRQADNDLIGTFRTKLAKVISDEAKGLERSEIKSENCKLLFGVFVIELHKAIKIKDEEEIVILMEQKFPSYFQFAMKSLSEVYDEPAASFLTIILTSAPQLKKFLPADTCLKIWKSLRHYERGNWRVFCSLSNDDFNVILSDLLQISKQFFTSGPQEHLSNYFDIWFSFFEFSSESKRQTCQLLLQDLFRFTHDCNLLLTDLSIKKRIYLIKFYSFCVSSEKVILTSHMLDTIIHVLIDFLDDSSPTKDFHSLFVVEVDVALAILVRQFFWTKNKVHLSFILFKRMLDSLTKRSDVSRQVNNDDVILLSACAFVMEKWVKLMVKKKKDFTRTVAYFIMTIISTITSITILPAIKFHLINYVNHFLSISDSHTVSYLMRVLKPGHQQVFNSIYNQFKKYHKYTGKI